VAKLNREFIDQLLNNKRMLLTEIYFALHDYLEQFYPEVVLLMEVGSFFELYQYGNRGRAEEIASLLNIQLTKKNKTIPEVNIKNPLMAGFPAGALERYLERLVDENRFTIGIVRQKGTPPKIKRYLGELISPGVNTEFVKEPENYLSSIIIEKGKGYYVGYSSVDLNTGKTYIFEGYSTREDPTLGLDELFRLLQTYKTNEIVLTLRGETDLEQLTSYLEIRDKTIVSNKTTLPIGYQNELFKRVFGIKSLLTPIEVMNLERYPLATESLGILLEFAISHNSEVVSKLHRPKLLESNKFVYLGNNPVRQLEIYKILKLIDKTKTPMGKRLLKERLFNPIKDEQELNRRYQLIDTMIEKYQQLELHLSQIYDMERLWQRIKVGRLHPYELQFLATSLEGVAEIKRELKEKGDEVYNLLHFLKTNFKLEKITSRLEQIRENFLKPGVDPEVDRLERRLKEFYNRLEQLRQGIGQLGEIKVDLNRTEKEGFYLSLTKTRFRTIKGRFLETFLDIDGERVFLKDFKIRQLTNSVKITGGIIDRLGDQILLTELKLTRAVAQKYRELLHQMELSFTHLSQLAAEVAEIDVAIAGAKTALQYKWYRPTIGSARLRFKELRHPLVEQNQENGLYIPNDLDFDQYQGILLYGINSSGKSSLMKSIGIALFLAQGGFFVPATEMEFRPYSGIFARIEASDNLAKGLSTFAVEMLELKNIFNRANSNSIVLGDEIAHGTETLSAVAIVASAIIRLVEKGATFLFATHLHQLVELEEIKNLPKVVAKHLGVHYDGKKLIYNRKLQNGSGSTLYGLEFARSLEMDGTFLKRADQIRKRLAEEYSELELLTQRKRSRYNRQLFIATCAICGKPVEDVHHIYEKGKGLGGFVGNLPVNHKYNLLPLCKKHHRLVHQGRIIIKGFITTSEGIQLHWEELDEIMGKVNGDEKGKKDGEVDGKNHKKEIELVKREAK